MANMNFGVNILPKATNTYSLGNSDYKWLVNGFALNEASAKEVDTSITSTTSVNLPTTSAVVAYIIGMFNNPVFTGTVSKGRLSGSTVGSGSVALGADVTASGTSSFAVGNQTIANHYAQMVLGEFNVADASTAQATSRGNYILIVGNGTENNARSDALTLDWNGNLRIKGSLYVGANADGTGGTAVLTSHQDISGKANKVSNATNGNFASLNSSGDLVDSGHKHSDYLTSHQDISGKADKVSSATNGNFASLNSSGNLVDSGKKASDFLTQHQDISGKADKYSDLEVNSLIVNQTNSSENNIIVFRDDTTHPSTQSNSGGIIYKKGNHQYVFRSKGITNGKDIDWQLPVPPDPTSNATYLIYTAYNLTSKSASSGGTDVSLVTTGEKATWNSKTSNTGTVTSVTITQGAGITVSSSGTAITTTGTRTISITGMDTSSGDTSKCLTQKGTWASFSNNAGTVTSVTITQGAGITVSSSGTAITGSGTRTISITGMNTSSGSTSKCLTEKGTWASFTNNAGTITGITMNGASKGTSGVVDLGTVITAHQDISGKANKSDTVLSTTLSRDRKANTTVGIASIAFGSSCEASQTCSFAFGTSCTASGANSFATGISCTSSGFYSFSSGSTCTAGGYYSVAMGYKCSATGYYSVAMGGTNSVSGFYSFSCGSNNTVSGSKAFAIGQYVVANSSSQFVFGEFNVADTNKGSSRGTYIEIVGNGTNIDSSNARTLDWSGNERLNGTLYINCNANGTGGTAVVGRGCTWGDLKGT